MDIYRFSVPMIRHSRYIQVTDVGCIRVAMHHAQGLTKIPNELSYTVRPSLLEASMTALWPQAAITYPSSDGEPVAETYAHFYALLITLEVLAAIPRGAAG
jgi:hypothetical protein